MDPGKIGAIKEWKSPKNKKELQVSWDLPISIDGLSKISQRIHWQLRH